MIKKKSSLIFEQLEERIFLDANPLLILDPALDPGGDEGGEMIDVPLESAAETAAAEPEKSGDGADGATEEAEGETSEKTQPGTSAKTAPEDLDSENSPDENRSTGELENEAARSTDSSEDTGHGESVSEQPEETVAGQATEIDSEKSPNPPIEDASEPLLSELKTDEAHPLDSTESDTGDEIVGSLSKMTVEGGEDEDSLSEDSSDAELQSGLSDSANEPIVLEPVDPLINEDFEFTYSFQNVIGQTGYGPYVDIYFPTNGIQGDYPDPQPDPPPASDVYDGIRFVRATYAGNELDFVEQRFDATGEIEHPYAKDNSGSPTQVFGQEGDTYVSILLPFGSYTPLQPAADIVVTAHMSNLAEVDELFEVTTSSGFRFGVLDATDNPISDPSRPNQLDDSTFYLAEVVRYNKSNTAREGETPTGPNYQQTYEIVVDVANEMTVENLTIIDTLPANIVFIPGTVSGNLVDRSELVGNDLIIELGDVTGVLGPDTTVSFNFYVADILADCDTSELAVNDMRLEAEWDPFDDRDPPLSLVIDNEVNADGTINTGPDDVLEAQPIIIQKTASDENGGDYVPGDIVVYTLDFYVSDYHALGTITIDDLIDDGILYFEDVAHQPNFVIQDQWILDQNSGSAYIDDFISGGAASEFNVSFPVAPSDSTGIEILVSDAMIRVAGDLGIAGEDGILEGGFSHPGSADTRAWGTITYFGQIQEDYISPPVTITQGDEIGNSVTISAERYGYSLEPVPLPPEWVLDPVASCIIEDGDDSAGTVTLPTGGITKEIYAINGAPVPGSPANIQPGDAVTYRIKYDLPISDFQDLVFSDYLPLPIFDADNPAQDPIPPAPPNIWTTDFSLGAIAAAQGGAVPGVGETTFGPDETFFIISNLAPLVSADGAQNSLIYDWDSYDDPLNRATVVDILFTVEVSTLPFADGLFLTNLVQGIEDGNFSSSSSSDIVQVILDQPELEIIKGVIQTDNTKPEVSFTADIGPVSFTAPGSAGFRGVSPITEAGLDTTPIDADLVNIDAGDAVSFAITVRNVGHFEAFNIEIDDDLPVGFGFTTIADLNLSVTDGAGAPIDFTDGDGNLITDPGFDFFGQGLEILDPLTANIDSVDQSDNILIITYDLVALTSVQPRQEMINTTDLTNYASAPDGPNYTPDPQTDDASVSVYVPEAAKEFDFTEIVDGINADNEAVIGEEIHYRALLTLQEGTTNNVRLTDTLDPGLELVSIDRIEILDQNNAPRPLGLVTSSRWGDFSTFGPLTSADGTDISYSFSETGQSQFELNLYDLVNSDTDNSLDEIVAVYYTAMAANIGSNVDGTTLANNASLSYDTATGNESTGEVRAAEVEVIEPLLKVIKTTTVNGSTDSGPPPLLDSQDPMDSVIADSGDQVQYFITIEHDDGAAAGVSTAHAYEVEISDIIPAELIGVTLQSADHTSLGDIALNLDLSGDDASGYVLTTTTPFELEIGDTVTIELSGELRFDLVGGPDIINEARIQWTSFENPAADPTQNREDHSGFVTSSDIDAERTGDSTDPGGDSNDYNDWDPTKITLRIPAEKYVVNSEFPGGDPDNTDGSTPLPDPVAGDLINSGREAVIGELITFKVEVAIPEAFFTDVVFTDVLDAGLSLVSIDSISLIEEDPVPPSPPLTGYVIIENDQLIGSSHTDDSSPFITYTHAPGNGNSDTLTIDFGDIENLNRDNQYEERIEVVYTVMATNITDNTGAPYGTATTLQNSITVSVVDPTTGDIYEGTTAQAEPVTVLEPQLVIDKTVAITGPGDAPGDAGDTIEYIITVGHSAASDTSAYDVVLTDTFVAEIINPQIQSAQINGVDIPGFSIIGDQLVTPAGLDLELTPSLNEELVLVITGTMADTVQPRDTISNSVEATWTSIPGTRQDISGFANTSDTDSERTGDPVDGGGAANKYLISDDAVTDPVPEPTLVKDLLGTDVTDSANEDDEATIGEQITYQITVGLSEGTTPNAQVVDTLSDGIAYVDDSFAIALSPGASITTSYGDFDSLPAPVVAGQNITFDLGDLLIAGDNTGTPPPVDQGADQLIITYLAVVIDDITINDVVDVGPNSFSNEASFTYAADGSIGPVSAPEVNLVEPVVEIVKTVNGLADGVALTDADAGDPVTYEITIRHDTTLSGGDAYDVRLQDTLPTEIDFGAGAIASVNDNDPLGVGPLGPTDFVISGGVLQFAISGDPLNDSYTIERDRVITVNLAGTLNDSVEAGQEIVNTASTDWTGLPDGHPNDGTTAERGDDGDHAAGIYTDEDDALITTAGPDIDKVNDAVVTIGDTHTYEIVVTLPEGTTNDLIVYDQVPDGLAVESVVSDLSNLGTPGTDYVFERPDPAPVQVGSLISLDYGDVSIVGDNDPANDSFTVELTVRVENIAANDDGDLRFNHAYLTYVEPDSELVRIDDPDDPELLIVEPWISTDKTVVDESGDQTVSRLGEVLTYTVELVNDGNSTAYEVSLEDVIAPGTGFDPATGLTSITTTAPGAETDPAAITIAFDGTTIAFSDDSWDLRPDDTLTLSYNLVVLDAYFDPVGPHINTADADWSSLDGTPPEERIYDDGVTPPGSFVDGDQDSDTAQFFVPDGDGEIGDFVWYDANASGTPQPEPEEAGFGLRGVQLDISASFNGVQYYSDTVATGDDGTYLFQGLQGNVEYVVTLDPTTLPDGMVETFARDGAGTNTATHFLTAAGGTVDSYLDADFSYTGSGALGDRVFYDPDNSGLPDNDPDEPGFQNVGVSLFLDLYGDGSFIIDETTTTGVDGIYGFANLFAATYTVTVDNTTLIDGLTPTDDLDGIGGGSDHTAQVALTAAQLVRDDVDFGYNGTGALGDRVFYDPDNSGLPDNDPGEPGFQNIEVSLFLDLYGDGSFIIDETTTTGVNGIYGFDNLFAATYTVTVDDATLPAGLTPTDDLDGIGGASDHTAQVALSATQLVRDDADFGYNGIGSLGDRVWYDADSNAIQDPGEPGLENITVTLFVDLYGDGSFIIDETTATGADGIYGFSNLFGAVYTVTVDDTTLPPGYEPTYDLDGIATPHTTQAELSAGQITRDDVDFGYFGTGAIGDRVWYDVNANGVQDRGEPGLIGITVVMEVDLGSDGTIDFTTSTVTGANGLYLFTDLLEASYIISIDTSTLPGGMQQTYDFDGLATPHTTALFLSDGDERLEIDFGYTGTGSIGDTIWYDANRNAIQDAGEPGIAGVSVTLSGTFGRSSYTTTTSTNANGIYLFTNLPAGRYSITLDTTTLPPGLQQTFDPDGLLDNRTSLTLGAGENNLLQDFGFGPPPEPPEPPRPPQPPQPPQPPIPPQPPEPQIPEPGDPLLAFQFNESAADRLVFPNEEDRQRVEPPVPISPIYTGLVEPGTTVNLTLRDSTGEVVASQMVIAGPAGNWLSGLEGILLYDTTHDITIDLDASLYNNSSPGLFNTRIYFNPTMIGLSSSSTSLDPEAIFGSTAEHSLRSINQWNNSLFDLEWDKFSGYEFFSPSINPAQHNR